MVKLIVATAKNRVIGKDNDLIWHLPADMAFFSAMTKGSVVLMGRKNWESIPDKYRPLPNRKNIVVTRDVTFKAEGCEVYHEIENAIDINNSSKERDLYIIGGGQIYDYCIENDLVDEMYVTKIDENFEGDTFFPEINLNNWNEEKLFAHPINEKNKYAFTVYRYYKK
ncbi:MAG: dihydrofolate reductase [Arenicella sp.]|jgi:dihydrofolate reductase